MRKRTPNLLIMLLLTGSMIVFSYINFCPSISEPVLVTSGSLIDASKEMAKLPEFEIVVSTIKAVVDFIMP